MTTDAKYFHSDMQGAPVLSGTAGAMTDLLDAILADGFNAKSVSSLVISGGVATATVTGGHGHEAGTVALVAGATPSGLNGEQRVTAIGANTISFATGLSDQTATGTITIKVAPLGWAKTYTGTNKRGYRPTAVEATGCLLRVDDTGTTNARTVGYGAMTDIDTGTDPFPTAAQYSGGAYWPKSGTANATARPWVAFGDARAMYIAVASGSTATNSSVMFFGDLIAYKSGDAYGCVLSGNHTNLADSGSNATGCMGFSDRTVSPTNPGSHVARSHTFVGSARPMTRVGASHLGTTSPAYSGNASYGVGAYPNAADNGLLVARVLGVSDGSVRGVFPGLWHVPLDVGTLLASRDKIAGTGDLAGKTAYVVRVGQTGGGTTGVVLFDVTGPWRTA